MTRRGKDTLTGDLFEVPQPAAPIDASMDYRREVAALISKVLKEADIDRHDVAASMSRLSGREVSKYMIDAWCSESRDTYNMPFYEAAVLETVCHSHALTNWLTCKRGAMLLVGRDALNAELGKLERLKGEAAAKIRDLKKMMGEEG